MAREFQGEDTSIVFLGSDGSLIELISYADQPARTIGDGISVGFAVEDLDAKMAFLEERGVEVTEGPFAPNPSIRFCFVRDPDNVRVQFVEEKRE